MHKCAFKKADAILTLVYHNINQRPWCNRVSNPELGLGVSQQKRVYQHSFNFSSENFKPALDDISVCPKINPPLLGGGWMFETITKE